MLDPELPEVEPNTAAVEKPTKSEVVAKYFCTQGSPATYNIFGHFVTTPTIAVHQYQL